LSELLCESLVVPQAVNNAVANKRRSFFTAFFLSIFANCINRSISPL
jgi:hypothetical protein